MKVRLRLLFEHEGEYESYADFYSNFISKEGMEGSTKRLCYYRTSVRTIQWFDEFDHFPNRLKFAPTGYRETSYGHLNLYFKGIVDNYVQVANRTSKHPKTIRVEANAVSSFLFHLQQNGAIDLCGITESMILSFFYDGCRQLRGCSYRVTKTKFALN